MNWTFLWNILALFSFNVTITEKKGKLLSLIQVYRHGERTPLKFYPNDPYKDISYWNLGAGELTNKGKLQLYEMGQYTRKRYPEFISKWYSENDFLVQSTNSFRTIQSAAAHVAGLYPPVGYQIFKPSLAWQPIPVFTVDKAIIGSYLECDAHAKALDTLYATDAYYIKLLRDNQYIFSYINKHAGTNITTLLDVYFVWDALNVESTYNYPLPKWARSVYPQPLTNLVFVFYLSISYTEELKHFSSGPFLHTTIRHFEEVVTDPTSVPRHLQFSGHDVNIAAILDSLEAFDPNIPGFASSLYFELRQRKENNYVNIYYSKSGGVEPVPVTLGGCGFDCNLEDFKSILKNRSITTKEWYKRCNPL